MPRGVVGVFVFACIGCASSPQKGDEASHPVRREQRVTNISYFDLENCFPRDMELPKPANKEGLIGFLVASRPEIGECLVRPEHRGAERTTRATIAVNVTDQGPEFQVTSQSVTPAGVECIRKALQARGKIEPLPNGAPPVSASIDYQHSTGVNPAVVMGVNEASDAVGTIRLAMKEWCGCFEPWKSAAPKSLMAKVVLVKGTPTPTEVTFEPPTDEASGRVQSCVTEKLKALPVPHTSDRVEVPLPIFPIHSGVDEELAPDKPELAFLQLEAIRTQRAADVALAIGSRATAVTVYDGLVAKYKANPKSVTVKDLRERCQKLLQTDDAWIAGLEKQLRSEDRTLAFAKSQQAKDDSWGEVATAAHGQVEASQKELEGARATRKQDEGACPKVTYSK
jgi:hypothetical protein